MKLEIRTLGSRTASRRVAAAPTHGVHFLERQPIRLIWRKRPLRTRLLERAVAKVDGDHVLDDLTVSFPSSRDVLLAHATDKILIERNADSMRSRDDAKRTADNGPSEVPHPYVG